MAYLSSLSDSIELAAFIESRIVIGMTRCEPIHEIAQSIAECVASDNRFRKIIGEANPVDKVAGE